MILEILDIQDFVTRWIYIFTLYCQQGDLLRHIATTTWLFAKYDLTYGMLNRRCYYTTIHRHSGHFLLANFSPRLRLLSFHFHLIHLSWSPASFTCFRLQDPWFSIVDVQIASLEALKDIAKQEFGIYSEELSSRWQKFVVS